MKIFSEFRFSNNHFQYISRNKFLGNLELNLVKIQTTLVYQKGFVTGGGEEANSRYIDLLDSTPGKTCLDIGSGLGGNAIQMATEYGF